MTNSNASPEGARGRILGYRELTVWQRAMDLVVEAYQISQSLPATERYGLTSQLTRAAVSVPANIAEGQGRLTSGDFARHLAIARGSLMEVETLLLVTERLEMVSADRVAGALAKTDEISRMLSTLIAKLGKSPKR